MPFKIKDLMINIAPSESGEGTGECVTGKKTNTEGGCTGKRTDVTGCPGKRTDLTDCTGKRTDLTGCPGKRTDAGCPTRRTDLGCPGKRTDVAMCLGGRTDVEIYIDAGRGPGPVCVKCTVKSHRPEYSAGCGPEETLDELNAIKAELQAELAAVEQEILEVEETLHPKTVADVEELQAKLQEALDELGKIKADLEKE